jgi:short-subunit dehydrogenase
MYLAHRLGTKMVKRGRGRILFTGSVPGFMPGTYQAVESVGNAFFLVAFGNVVGLAFLLVGVFRFLTTGHLRRLLS